MARSRGGVGWITIEGLEWLGADLEHLAYPGLFLAINRALRGKGGRAMVEYMHMLEPERSGDLKRKTKIHAETHTSDVLVGYLGELSHGNKGGGRNQKGAWIESGVKPHDIVAKRNKQSGEFTAKRHSLFFGGTYTEKVHHPGFRGRKIAKKAMDATETTMLAAVVEEIDQITGSNASGRFS